LMLRYLLDTNLCIPVIRDRPAGHAQSQRLVVVTGNLKEFGRVERLGCEDWVAEVG